MRNSIVAGNWKMNLSLAEGKKLVEDIINEMPALNAEQQVVFCTPFIHLPEIFKLLQQKQVKNVFLGAQNCHDKPGGAYTGEVSIPMLKECGVSHVIIGHSERRQYFKESNSFLKNKVDALIANEMQVIFCCGEPLEVRNDNTQNEFVAVQLQESLFHLSETEIRKFVTIAYEPIWAIGTGVTASTEQAQEMHEHIRKLIAEQYNTDTANAVSILYGGSCNAQNAFELFKNEDVDGGLIGGAALKAETFVPIINAMQ